MNYNYCIFVGRIASDITKVNPGAENEAVTFRIAVNRDYKDANGNTPADFISCITGGKLGEIIAQYAEKGRLVLVAGQLHTRQIEKSGVKYTAFSIRVDNFKFMEPKKNDKTDEDEIPF